MKTPTHTPKWEVRQTVYPGDESYYIKQSISETEELTIARVFSLDDARLIAAAPDLLKAAKVALTLCDLIYDWSDANYEERERIMNEIESVIRFEKDNIKKAIAEASC